MIRIMLDILNLDEWFGQSALIDFAKGSHKIETKFKKIYEQEKRKAFAKKYTK